MIYIDASRYNNTNKRTGVENYSYFLINELVRQFGQELHLVSPRKIDLDVKQSVIPFPRFWTHLRLSWFVLSKPVKRLFVPSHVLPLICPKHAVITIHDVAFKRFPESYTDFSRWYLDWSTRFAVKKAAAIITPSKATKDDLLSFYGADDKKIHVVPLGTERNSTLSLDPFGLTETEEMNVLKKYLTWPNHQIADPAKIKQEKLSRKTFFPPYFLYVGRVEHKKNTDTLLKAFKILQKIYPDIFLVLAGFKGVGAEEIMKKIDNLPFERLAFTGYVSEKEKHVLMKHASAFVFPSRYEGFGLPLLEAMHYKLPIIASNIPSSKEILGDEAYYFETENETELAQKMQSLLEGDDQYQKWLGNYHKKLNLYSWGKCAVRTMKIISGDRV